MLHTRHSHKETTRMLWRRRPPTDSLPLIGAGSVLILIIVAYLSLRDTVQLHSSDQIIVVANRTGDDNLDDTSSRSSNKQNKTSRSSSLKLLLGKWVYVGPNRTFAVPICCGWDHGEFKHHKNECGTEKSNTEFYRGPLANNGLYQQIGGNACRRENSDKNDKFVDEWKWLSPDLPSSFDAHATCRQLNGRTVLFLGDSTMQQTAATLMNALKPGGCAHQLLFQLSDTLIHRPLGNLNRGKYWIKAVRKHQPDIVVMNAGAHVRTNTNYTVMLDEVILGIHKWRDDPQNKNTTFVWKTQQPGGCQSRIVEPDNPIGAALEFDFSLTPLYELYEYNNFYRRDLYTMQRWFDELEEGHAHILDLRMLYSRGDAHPGSGQADPQDCLHFLAPGPLDVVASVFQKLLMEMDSSK